MKLHLYYEDIIKILPHRYPFLMVDRIIEMEPEKRVVGIKNVTANEPFFRGHFPIDPIMPGVLIIEAMAQTGAVLLLDSMDDPTQKIAYFMAIDKVRFKAETEPDILGEDAEFKIHLKPDAIAQTFEISDNGIGMTYDEVLENIGTIAKSGTNDFLEAMEQLNKEATLTPELIGQFGEQKRSPLPFDEIPPQFIEALLAAEDASEAVVWASSATRDRIVSELINIVG